MTSNDRAQEIFDQYVKYAVACNNGTVTDEYTSDIKAVEELIPWHSIRYTLSSYRTSIGAFAVHERERERERKEIQIPLFGHFPSLWKACQNYVKNLPKTTAEPVIAQTNQDPHCWVLTETDFGPVKWREEKVGDRTVFSIDVTNMSKGNARQLIERTEANFQRIEEEAAFEKIKDVVNTLVPEEKRKIVFDIANQHISTTWTKVGEGTHCDIDVKGMSRRDAFYVHKFAYGPFAATFLSGIFLNSVFG